MLDGLLSGFTAYKNALYGAVLFAVLAFLGIQTLRLDHAQAAVKVLTAEKAGLEGAIAGQNAGIAAVAVERERLKSAGIKAGLAASKALATAEARAVAIETMATPGSCEAAVQALVEDAADK